jgi:type VI protein secretion system component VasF
MRDMNELSAVLSELRRCGENLTGLADALRDLFIINVDAPAGETEQTEAEIKQPQIAEVRAVLAEKSSLGYTEAVRDLLLKYGAPRLSEIDPACYTSLLAEAKVLGNE